MTCLKYYPLCLLTKTVFCLHFIIHDTTAKKKSLVIFFFSAILRIQLLQFMRYAMKALRCNGFVAGPNSAGSFYVLSYYTLLWKTCFKCPSREIHSPSGFAAILAYPWIVTNLFLFAPESLHDTVLIQSPGDFCEAYFGVIFQCLPAVLLRLTKIR